MSLPETRDQVCVIPLLETVAYTGADFFSRCFPWGNRLFTTTGTTKSLFLGYRTHLSLFSSRVRHCRRDTYL